MEDVNKQRRNFFLFLSLNIVAWNSASGGFAYNWQSKWIGIITIKTERTQVHFLSDVLVAVSSLDLKVSILVNHNESSLESSTRGNHRTEIDLVRIWVSVQQIEVINLQGPRDRPFKIVGVRTISRQYWNKVRKTLLAGSTGIFHEFMIKLRAG